MTTTADRLASVLLPVFDRLTDATDRGDDRGEDEALDVLWSIARIDQSAIVDGGAGMTCRGSFDGGTFTVELSHGVGRLDGETVRCTVDGVPVTDDTGPVWTWLVEFIAAPEWDRLAFG